MSARDLSALLRKVSSDTPPDPDDLVALLGLQDTREIRALHEAADAVRRRYMGDGILLRGIVEFGSFCRNTCAYCGLHAGNTLITRYRMSTEEIIGSVRAIAAQGIRTVVLQSGEDDGLDPAWLAELVREIRGTVDIAITLSAGERPREDYRLWRDAGADRYLLKIESSDGALYQALHLRRTLESRLRSVADLFDLGYQVGSGIMVGLPGQTLRHIAGDILYFARNDFDMIGIGPFIPHPHTRLGGAAKGEVALTLKTIAVTRIITRDSHLPATTALGSMDRDYRTDGLKAGANVLMPNFTPLAYKKLYEIYPGKRCLSEPTGACGFCMEGLARSIGRTIDSTRGDTLKRRVSSPGG
jgi:biotin synthase